MTSKC